MAWAALGDLDDAARGYELPLTLAPLALTLALPLAPLALTHPSPNPSPTPSPHPNQARGYELLMRAKGRDEPAYLTLTLTPPEP